MITQTPTLANPTQIAQNRDVFPGDWAYEALQNLSQNYNCITGYPDDTFQGDRVLTRYEFAAGLVSCIQSIESKILESGDFATQEDWQEMGDKALSKFREDMERPPEGLLYDGGDDEYSDTDDDDDDDDDDDAVSTCL